MLTPFVLILFPAGAPVAIGKEAINAHFFVPPSSRGARFKAFSQS
jgi:hypothetical protein